jgi:hypothetical protein
MNIDRAHEIITDTLMEYLFGINKGCCCCDVIQNHQFDEIADSLINKLFVYKKEDSKLMRDDICMIPNCGKISSSYHVLCKDHK